MAAPATSEIKYLARVLAVVFFPITLGFLLAKLNIKLYGWVLATVYITPMRRAFKYFTEALLFVVTVCALLFLFISFGLSTQHLHFEVKYLSPTDPNNPWTKLDLFDCIKDLKAYCYPNDISTPIHTITAGGILVRVFTMLAVFIVCFWSIFAVCFYLIKILSDSYITSALKKDRRLEVEAKAAGTVYVAPRRPLIVACMKITSYDSTHRVLRMKKVIAAKERYFPQLSKGAIFSKINYVTFEKDNWKNNIIFFGAEGSGKTNSELNWILSALYNNDPVIIDDPKNNQWLLDMLSEMSMKLNRPLVVFEPGAHYGFQYNPFINKSPTRIVSMLVNTVVEKRLGIEKNEYLFNALNTIVNAILASDNHVSFQTLSEFTNITTIKNAFKDCKNTLHRDKMKFWLNLVDDIDTAVLKKLANIFSVAAFDSEDALTSLGGFSMEDVLKERQSNTILLFRTAALKEWQNPNMIKRLIYSDLLVNSEYNSRQRMTADGTTLVIFRDLFNSVPETLTISSLIMDLNNGMYSIGLDVISVDQFESRDKGSSKAVFSQCDTFLIHKNNDALLQMLLSDILKTTHVVDFGFQYKDVASKYRNITNAANISLKQDELKKTIINRANTLAVGEVIYRTTHTVYSSDGARIKATADILYSQPFVTRDANKVLSKYGSKFIGNVIKTHKLDEYTTPR